MGLGITAYGGLTKIDCVFDAHGEPINPNTREQIEHDFRAHINHDFPDRALGIEDEAVYAASDKMSFRAGSYGSYNGWRNELAKIAGYPSKPVDRYNTGSIVHRHDQGAWDADGGPFWELIWFSDCDGVIGPVVSAKLAKDFAEYQFLVNQHQDEMFRDLYAKWRKAFEMAANNGAVEFH